ncbi:MAG: ABC transporter permease [Sphaerimonospora mesophila]
MNNVSRGVRNAFRNGIRTVSIVLILALAVGLALAMLVARQAVNKKISEVKSSIGNNITISPAGTRSFGFGGFSGGGNNSNSGESASLTNNDLTRVKSVDHITKVVATLSERATTDEDTNLTSPTPTRNSNDDSGNVSNIPANMAFPIGVTGTTDAAVSISNLGEAEISDGETIDGASSDYVALIGDQLAEKNNLSVGSTFTLYDKTFTVKGIISSTSSSDDSSRDGMGRNLSIGSAIIVPLATLQNITDNEDTISSITAVVDNVENTNTATSAITTALGTDDDGNNRADVTSDADNAQTALDSLESIKTTSVFSLLACAVAAAVIILLAMLMIVRERRGEVGVLKAIGAKSSSIIKMFAVESLTLTLLASIIGIGVGVLASGPLTSSLVNSSSSETSQTEGPGNMRGGPGNFLQRGFNSVSNDVSTITAQVDWNIVFYALGSAMVIALVGASTASLIVMRVRPAEAVRAE